MSDGNQNNSKRRTFTTGFTLYDNQNSSLRLGFVEGDSFVDMAPVFPEMIGKTPQKGDKVYSYDHNIMGFFRLEDIAVMADRIEALEKGEVDELVFGRGNKNVVIFNAGYYEGIENRCVAVRVLAENGEDIEQWVQFEFRDSEVVIGTKEDGEGGLVEVKKAVSTDWEIFKGFLLEATAQNAYGYAIHGARCGVTQMGGSGGGRSGGPAASSPGGPPQRRVRQPGAPGGRGGANVEHTADPGAADKLFDEDDIPG